MRVEALGVVRTAFVVVPCLSAPALRTLVPDGGEGRRLAAWLGCRAFVCAGSVCVTGVAGVYRRSFVVCDGVGTWLAWRGGEDGAAHSGLRPVMCLGTK